jgi:hypothetical protein
VQRDGIRRAAAGDQTFSFDVRLREPAGELQSEPVEPFV